MNKPYNLRNKIVSLAPNSVASKNTTQKHNATDEENSTLTEMATFSTEQFQQILAAMGSNSRCGSFTQCTARFKGQRDPAAVEEFLAAVTVFKDIERISDADAVKGMPLLLEEYAASWWIGIKDTVRTFEQAVTLIRTTFTPPVPDWRIFSNLFEEKQQKKEPTDSFICKKRLLLSQLKLPPSEAIQLNMVYGLLNLKIRERVRREAVNSFEDLVSASREAEMLLSESQPTATIDVERERTNSNRCSFCRIKGHTVENCFKKKKQQNSSASQQQPIQKSEVMRKPIFSCYGCGAPGVYRSNCPTCTKNPNVAASPQHLAFNSISSTVIGHSLPTTYIEIFGLKGEAIFDCGAKTSIASQELKKILDANNCVFQEVHAEVTLADGSLTTGKVMSTICDVTIGNRVRKIRFVYLPNAIKNRTLLGTDFLEQAGIVLNMAQKYWYFESEPKRKYNFSTSLTEASVFSVQVSESLTPCRRAIKEMSPFIKFAESIKAVSPLQRTPKPAARRNNSPTLPITPSFTSRSESLDPYLEQELLKREIVSEQEWLDKLFSSPTARSTSTSYSPQFIQSIFKEKKKTVEATDDSTIPHPPPAKSQKIDEQPDDYLIPLFAFDLKILKESFQNLKTSAAILKQATDGEPFILKTDASGFALGAVLLQGEGKDEHPIEYASRLLSSAERNYSTIEREALTPVIGASNQAKDPIRRMRPRGRPRK